MGELDLAPAGRLVEGGWARTLVAATVLALAFLGWWEGRWRSLGVSPSISDLDASWSEARDRAAGEAIALLGTSKMQSAVDPRALSEALGGRPVVQLALIDRSPLPILEDLAADGDFRGTAIVDVAPRIFFDGEGTRERAARQLLEARAAYLTSPGERVDARLTLYLENAFALRRPAFSLRRLTQVALTGRDIELPFARVRLDRFRELDFGRVDLAARRLSQATVVARAGRPASEVELAALIGRVVAAERALEARGGRVVLTLLPISGRAREEEERRFPREGYWDPLVARTGLPAIHFADHPALARFECVDGVHLAATVAGSFTRELAPLLEAAR